MKILFNIGATVFIAACLFGSAQAGPFDDMFFTPPGLAKKPDGKPPGQNKDKDKDMPPPGACVAKPEDNAGPKGRSGKSHTAHVNFSMVDEFFEPLDAKELPWGRMTYFWVGPAFDFVFNAHHFEPDGDDVVDYILTYQPEPFESAGVICLGDGFVNDEGDIHIANSVELEGNLPAEGDEAENGATLALVNAEDVNCEDGIMDPWIPENYLFTTSPVIFENTNLP